MAVSIVSKVLAFHEGLGLGAVEEVRVVAAVAQRGQHVVERARRSGAQLARVALEHGAVPLALKPRQRHVQDRLHLGRQCHVVRLEAPQQQRRPERPRRVGVGGERLLEERRRVEGGGRDKVEERE